MTLRIIIYLFIWLGLSTQCEAQLYDNLRSEIEKIIYYDTDITPDKNPGYIIGVVVGDSSFLFPFGSITKDSIQAPDADTYFEIGGLTKVYTATLVKVLENEGRIHLDSALNTYLPVPYRNPKFNQLSIRQLLTHYSGLPKMPLEFGSKEAVQNNPYANYSKNDLVRFYAKSEYLSLTNNYLYSHLGYALLELAIEHIMGLSYEEVLKDKVLYSLDLHATHVHLPAGERLAQGYAIGGKATTPWHFRSFAASEGLKTTVADLLKFVEANIGLPQGSEWNNILVPMHDPIYPTGMSKGSYIAAGWHVIKYKKFHDLIVHSGTTSGHLAFAGFVKESRTGVVILSNSEYGMGGLGYLILRMLNNNWRKKR